MGEFVEGSEMNPTLNTLMLAISMIFMTMALFRFLTVEFIDHVVKHPLRRRDVHYIAISILFLILWLL